ncbi:MAG: hypothetical protein IPH59_16980 [bacterium]|nr:hypothetical protein [bacterium]
MMLLGFVFVVMGIPSSERKTSAPEALRDLRARPRVRDGSNSELPGVTSSGRYHASVEGDPFR